jgi:hypothetical protein
MSILLDRVNTATVINDNFSFEFTQWVANTIDTLNEIINSIEPTLVSIEETASNVNAVDITTNSEYIPTSTLQTVYTLPITSSNDIGVEVAIIGNGSGGWQIAIPASSGITVQDSSVPATATTSITSANRYDSIKIKLVDATTWVTVSSETTGFSIV